MFSLWKPQTLFQAFIQKPIQWFQDDEKFKNCSKNQTIAISYVPLYSLPTELQRAEWYLFGHHCEICHEEISICGNGQKDQKPLQEGSEANGWEGHCQTGHLQFDTCIFLIFTQTKSYCLVVFTHSWKAKASLEVSPLGRYPNVICCVHCCYCWDPWGWVLLWWFCNHF